MIRRCVFILLFAMFSLSVQAASGIIRRTPIVEPEAETTDIPVIPVETAKPADMAGKTGKTNTEAITGKDENQAASDTEATVSSDENQTVSDVSEVVVSPVKEEEVYDFLAKVDTAIKAKDAKALAVFISESAQIKLVLKQKKDGTTKRLTLDKDEYLMRLRNAWSLASNYNYRRNNEKISIKGDQVMVSNDVFESKVVSNQYVKTTSREKSVLKREDGKLRIVSINSSSSI